MFRARLPMLLLKKLYWPIVQTHPSRSGRLFVLLQQPNPHSATASKDACRDPARTSIARYHPSVRKRPWPDELPTCQRRSILRLLRSWLTWPKKSESIHLVVPRLQLRIYPSPADLSLRNIKDCTISLSTLSKRKKQPGNKTIVLADGSERTGRQENYGTTLRCAVAMLFHSFSNTTSNHGFLKMLVSQLPPS